jgi:hypothetical protein
MRSKIIFGCLLIFISFIIMGVGFSKGDNVTHYSNFITKQINQCAERSQNFCTAEMPKIKRESAIDCLKASYFSFHRKQLIDMMVEYNIGVEEHQMSVFLNGTFFEILRTAIEDYDTNT